MFSYLKLATGSLDEERLRSLLYPTMFLGVKVVARAVIAFARCVKAPSVPSATIPRHRLVSESSERRLGLDEEHDSPEEDGSWKVALYVSWEVYRQRKDPHLGGVRRD